MKGKVSFMRGKLADGAKPTVFLASSPEVEGVTGSFFNNKGSPPGLRRSLTTKMPPSVCGR
jgi:hypothetical protein